MGILNTFKGLKLGNCRKVTSFGLCGSQLPKLLFGIIGLLLPHFLFGANPIQTASHIHTVQLHKKGWNMAPPIIQLLANDQLTLSFDDFAYDSKNYQYTITHCTPNWEPSDLMQTEYMNGFMPNPVLDYQYAFNTTHDYIHYTLDFPNDEIALKISGNYIITVYEQGHESQPVLTRPFFVSESLVSIVPRIKYTPNSSLRDAMQEVNFSILHPHFNVNNPRDEIQVIIQQNGRWDNRKTDLKPVFIRQNELVYEFSRESLFDGGNEYRWLDLRSTRFAPEHVQEIAFFDPHFHFNLFPDRSQASKPYFYREDFNGKYYIDVREDRDPHIEADYVYVHFKLPVKNPLAGNVFVNGGLTDWQLDAKSNMEYNYQTMSYELTLLLKQGFYNYQYLWVEDPKTPGNIEQFEGNYGQTENDYTIYVYYRSVSDNYHRLIGVHLANSLKYIMRN